MHTNALNNIINASEQMSLDTTLIEGAKIFHTDTAEELLFHLRNIRNCNDSTNPSHVAAIDTEFDTNHDDKGDRRPILRLIGRCYITPLQVKRWCFWWTQRK